MEFLLIELIGKVFWENKILLSTLEEVKIEEPPKQILELCECKGDTLCINSETNVK